MTDKKEEGNRMWAGLVIHIQGKSDMQDIGQPKFISHHSSSNSTMSSSTTSYHTHLFPIHDRRN